MNRVMTVCLMSEGIFIHWLLQSLSEGSVAHSASEKPSLPIALELMEPIQKLINYAAHNSKTVWKPQSITPPLRCSTGVH